jgi:hypothetical protein
MTTITPSAEHRDRKAFVHVAGDAPQSISRTYGEVIGEVLAGPQWIELDEGQVIATRHIKSIYPDMTEPEPRPASEGEPGKRLVPSV